MTPREVDVAFVLEEVAGFRAVYAIEPGSRAAAHFDFAIEFEGRGRDLATMIYALQRVLTHDDCARVYFCTTTPPSFVVEAMRPLVLGEHDRDAARARVPAPVAGQLGAIGAARELRSVLVVSGNEEAVTTVRAALGDAGRCVAEPRIAEAVRLATTERFDLAVRSIPIARPSSRFLSRSISASAAPTLRCRHGASSTGSRARIPRARTRSSSSRPHATCIT